MAVQSNDDYEHGTYGPPPDDPMTFDATVEQDANRGRALLALVGVIFVAFGVVVWIAYQQGVRSGQEPGIIQADARPVKVPPADDPAAPSGDTDAMVNTLIEERAPGKIEEVFATDTDPKLDGLRPQTGDPATDSTTASTGGTGTMAAKTDAAAGAKTEVPAPPAGAKSPDAAPAKTTADSTDAGAAKTMAMADPDKAAAKTDTGTPAPKTATATDNASGVAAKPAATDKPTGQIDTAAVPSSTVRTAVATATGGYALQLASFKDAQQAADLWDRISVAQKDILDGLRPRYEVKQIEGKGTYHRLIVGPFDTREAAAQTCASLKAKNQDCLVRTN